MLQMHYQISCFLQLGTLKAQPLCLRPIRQIKIREWETQGVGVEAGWSLLFANSPHWSLARGANWTGAKSESAKSGSEEPFLTPTLPWAIIRELKAVFSRQQLSRLTFLKVVCLQTSPSDLKVIPIFTSKIKWGVSTCHCKNKNNKNSKPVVFPMWITASDSSLATWFGGLNLMRILLKFADSLNFKPGGRGTVFTEWWPELKTACELTRPLKFADSLNFKGNLH